MADDQRREQFALVYARTYPAIAGYALRRAACPEDAADVVAETYLVLWRRLDDAPSDDRILPWLYGVARRISSNQRRAQDRRLALTGRLTDELSLVAEVTGPDIATVDAIRRAFSRLSEDDRELLALVGWEGLDRAEIAVVLGVNRALVRLRLHRARQRLSSELSRDGISVGQTAAAQRHDAISLTTKPKAVS